MLIGCMVHAWRPAQFKESIEAALVLTQNKLYKIDLLELSWWLSSAARSFQPFASAYAETGNPKEKDKESGRSSGNDRSSGTGGRSDARGASRSHGVVHGSWNSQ